MHSIRDLLIATTLFCMESGCSWAFMTRPPTAVVAPNHPVECTTSVAAPVLDSICAGYFVANAIALGAGNYDSSTQSGGIALSLGLVALCGLSAISGYGHSSRCEKVKDANALCMSGSLSACHELRADWSPPPGATYTPASMGCSRDIDCKGDRICDRGACVAPQTPVQPKAMPPAPAAPPAKPAGSCERDSDCDRGICFEGVCRD
jgi:hypothetical protein